MTLDQARKHIGHGVVYRAPHDPLSPEDGVITSVSKNYVFVRYAGDTGSKATAPEWLTLLAGDAQ